MMGTSVNNSLNIGTKEENSDKSNDEEVEDLEWSPDQEILLLYSLQGLKPVGPHKHFRMLLIHERLSNAMNKKVSSKAIWKKLNTWYDLEALDEAEAEADAASAVEVDFELPRDEFREMMNQKLKGLPMKVEKMDLESEPTNNTDFEILREIKVEPDSSSQDNEMESNKELSDMPKGVGGKDGKKEIAKRGTKKKDLTPVKDNTPVKKEIVKDGGKKDMLGKKDEKDPKKLLLKEDDKKETGKKAGQETKKDMGKEEKKEVGNKVNKRDSADKKQLEQSKKEAESKKGDQKKSVDPPKTQRAETAKPRAETPKQLRTEAPKRTETKTTRSETPKPQRVDSLKKESSAEKKKEASEKKVERRSPEKTPESVRGGKLRTRERKDTESEKLETPTGTKRERAKDSASKAGEPQVEEPPAKKAKIAPLVKVRPTRNSVEPQKPASPASSPQKRRTRLL